MPRPKNTCSRCKYEWFPRGRDASRRCPGCGVVFDEVTVAVEQKESEGSKFLKAFAGCVMIPVLFLGGCGLLLERFGGADKKPDQQAAPNQAAVAKQTVETKQPDDAGKAATNVPKAEHPRDKSAAQAGKKWSPDPTKEGQEYVRAMLTELDSFRNDPQFHELGFAIAGPFHAWLKSIQANASNQAFSSPERIAVGDLMNMGMDYMRNKGNDTKYTTFARAEILKTLSAPVVVKSPDPAPSTTAVAPDPRVVDRSLPPAGSFEPTEWKRLGAIETRVAGVKLAPAPMRDRSGREFLTPEPVLRVWVECRSVLPAKNELRRWVSALEPVRLSGPPGTAIERMKTISGADVEGELRGGHRLVPGGDPVRDVVLFNPPGPKAGDLVLTLNGAHLGESGTMMHTIRAEWWQR
jgi:hypothetical protein